MGVSDEGEQSTTPDNVERQLGDLLVTQENCETKKSDSDLADRKQAERWVAICVSNNY